jgi:hypothetical protein
MRTSATWYSASPSGPFGTTKPDSGSANCLWAKTSRGCFVSVVIERHHLYRLAHDAAFGGQRDVVLECLPKSPELFAVAARVGCNFFDQFTQRGRLRPLALLARHSIRLLPKVPSPLTETSIAGLLVRGSKLFCHNPGDLPAQHGAADYGCLPHFVPVDSEISTDEDVPERDDLWPCDLRIPASQLVGKSRRRLPNNSPASVQRRCELTQMPLSFREAPRGPASSRRAPPDLHPHPADTPPADRCRCRDASRPARPIQKRRVHARGIDGRVRPIQPRQPRYPRDGAFGSSSSLPFCPSCTRRRAPGFTRPASASSAAPVPGSPPPSTPASRSPSYAAARGRSRNSRAIA